MASEIKIDIEDLAETMVVLSIRIPAIYHYIYTKKLDKFKKELVRQGVIALIESIYKGETIRNGTVIFNINMNIANAEAKVELKTKEIKELLELLEKTLNKLTGSLHPLERQSNISHAKHLVSLIRKYFDQTN